MNDLITAIGLLFFIEGLFIAIFPSRIKNMLELIKNTPENKLRTYGVTFLIIGFILIWVLVVFAGKHLVGNTTLLIGCLILLPFIVFVCLGIPQVEPHRWLAGPPNDATFADFCAFCSLLYWNFSGADQISTFASEVKNPKKTYPRSVIAGVTLVGVTYLLPLGTAAGLLDGLDKTNFTDGSLVHQE